MTRSVMMGIQVRLGYEWGELLLIGCFVFRKQMAPTRGFLDLSAGTLQAT